MNAGFNRPRPVVGDSYIVAPPWKVEGDGDGGLLTDWTSIHLDVTARDRGLTRLAASQYEL